MADGVKRGKFPPELLQKIKETVNLVEIVGEHVVLRKSGANHTGLCPFHSERTPSFSVSEGKQLYHCYGCKKSGDLFSFVMDIYGVGFPEAVEDLAERGKIPLPKDWNSSKNEDPETAARKEAAREKLTLAHRLNLFVATFYQQMLKQNVAATEYFRKRGCGDELSRSFYLGYAPSGWDALASKLIASKAPLPLAQELGLIRPSQKQTRPGGVGYFDLFRNRAMFPIADMRGKVVAFGGRSLPAAKGEDDGPKYLNSPESFLFQKSKIAFGLFQAQKHIREKDEIIVVEGYFDVMAMQEAGFKNVVATCGTALTPDHLQLFRRFASRVVLLFDGDKAGISATERAMETGLEESMILYGAVMPKDLDPDEILFDQNSGQLKPQGREQMASVLNDAKPLLDERISEQIQLSNQGPEQRTQAIKRIGAWLAKYRDPVGKEVRLQSVREKLGVRQSLLEQAMDDQQRQFRPAAPRQSVLPKQPAQPLRASKPHSRPLTQKDEALLRAWLSGSGYAKVMEEVRGKLPPGLTFADLFDSGPARGFTSALLKSDAADLGSSLEKLLAEATDPKIRSIITETLVGPQDAESATAPATPRMSLPDFKASLDRSLARVWARFSQQIKMAIADAEARKDAELEANLKKEYLDVQRKMKEFSSSYDEAQGPQSLSEN